eukprot:c12581_g1_i2.p2 GENE.c12581_g1_i2~~c12581_g1_i2.p2  ORF type:complete len:124 (-),score=12.06 c12581_g1_i2:48-419(-)
MRPSLRRFCSPGETASRTMALMQAEQEKCPREHRMPLSASASEMQMEQRPLTGALTTSRRATSSGMPIGIATANEEGRGEADVASATGDEMAGGVAMNGAAVAAVVAVGSRKDLSAADTLAGS